MIRLHVTNTGVDLRILGHTIAAITDDRDTSQRTEAPMPAVVAKGARILGALTTIAKEAMR